jgi:hypothetical protein
MICGAQFVHMGHNIFYNLLLYTSIVELIIEKNIPDLHGVEIL